MQLIPISGKALRFGTNSKAEGNVKNRRPNHDQSKIKSLDRVVRIHVLFLTKVIMRM
ncbi:hypothetical protein [Leptospira stimsonii]|uniref:hypothetical protein n=1 Tax=Leptospira stimsonii TaxID=2202203 RepID=UPI001314CC3E|nr:hypothetical protein [Leptospira stimsonii]